MAIFASPTIPLIALVLLFASFTKNSKTSAAFLPQRRLRHRNHNHNHYYHHYAVHNTGNDHVVVSSKNSNGTDIGNNNNNINNDNNNNNNNNNNNVNCQIIAAEYLLPVLYPSSNNDNHGKTVSPDKALKRCLRAYERFLRRNNETTTKNKFDDNYGDTTLSLFSKLPSSSREEREANRKALSDLIIGTSVMRLRHFWTLLTNDTDKFDNNNNINKNSVEPIVGVEPWMMMKLHSSNGDISGSDTDDIVDSNDAGGDLKQQQQTIHPNHNRINLIQQLVKLHATYNEENKKGTNDQQESSTATNTDTTVISWSEDDVDDNDDNNYDDDIVKIYRSIAVQQSLPSFIVRLWVKQYGAAAANIIAQRANKPGPITLRRNALRCKSDNELLRRLKKEGDIDAYVFDGASDSDSDTGDVEGRRIHYAPKEGCIQLFGFDGQQSEKQNNATTTTTIPHPRRQRQRRPNKSLWSLQSWQDGLFEVQDVGSQLIVDAVEVQYGDVVIDYCAGNGGKTLALSSHMWNNNNNNDNDNHNRLEEEDDDYNDHDTTATTTTSTIPKSEDGGTIIAHDVVESRLAQIRGSLARAGLVVDDDEEEQQLQQSPRRRRIPPRVVTTSNATQLSELDAELADAVLVDAPCSSLGVLRRRPGHRWTLTESAVCEDFPKLQLDILKNASLLVKPSGGKLVYATCSICKEENENVVKQFEELSFSIDNDQHHHDDNDGLLLLFEDVWERWKFDGTDSHCRSTVIPHVENGDCDGFFVARWKRKGVVDIL